MIGEDILIKIDETLDRLIRNAEAFEDVTLEELSEVEIEAFQKTQESLLQHLLHMDETLKAKKQTLRMPHQRSAGSQIQEKLLKFERMKSSYHQQLEKRKREKPLLLGKRRQKKIL